MEAVTTQDIGVNDLRWIIDYRPRALYHVRQLCGELYPERA